MSEASRSFLTIDFLIDDGRIDDGLKEVSSELDLREEPILALPFGVKLSIFLNSSLS